MAKIRKVRVDMAETARALTDPIFSLAGNAFSPGSYTDRALLILPTTHSTSPLRGRP